VVGTVDLKTPLELKTIALHARNAEYNPKVRNLLAWHDGAVWALYCVEASDMMQGLGAKVACVLAK
jgi:TATA-box binding protein (TBP) (component of TFIID and TFIIIB)